MDELKRMVSAVEEAQDPRSLALATLVDDKPVRAQKWGCKLLVLPADYTIGMIGSDPIQRKICATAATVVQSEQPCLLTLKLAAEDTLNVESSGVELAMRVFVEPIGDELFCPIGFVKRCFQAEKRGAIATIFSDKCSEKMGSRLLLTSGLINSSIESTQLESLILRDSYLALQQEKSVVKRYLMPCGIAEVLIEVVL